MSKIWYFIIFNFLTSMIYAQTFQIAHPYREIDYSSNGHTTNGSKLYISTVYDGHIYEFDFAEPDEGLVDRFRIYPEVKIYPCAGSPIYLPDQDKLYVGSSWGNKIYIFENIEGKPGTENLPEKTLSVENEDIAFLYRPHRYDKNIYWGCYHSDKSGWAKIVKFDITGDTTSIVKFSQIEAANYTHALAIAGDYLYAGTENGHIVKYNLRTNAVDSSIIDLGVKEKVYFMTSDNSNLYAMMNQSKNPLYKIENPESENPVVKNIIHPGYKFSRIFYHDDYLYASKWKYKVSADSILKSSYDIGLLGGVSIDGKKYLLDLRNDERSGIRKKQITQIQVPSGSTRRFTPVDIAGKEMGAQLQTLEASAYSGKLYMSTYWVGTLYEYDETNGMKKIIPTVERLNQADIIKSYNNYVLFGCYGGERDGYLIKYNQLAQTWTKIEVDNDPKTNEQTSRLTSIAIDPESKKVFIGTGEQTRTSSTQNAVLRYLPIIISNKFTNMNYDQSYLQDPVRFVSLVYYDNFLYGVSYTRDLTHHLFKLDISDPANPEFSDTLALGKLNRFKGFRDKMLHLDSSRLLCGLGNELQIFDLNNFQINNPVLRINYEEAVGDIISDETNYYLCFKKHIKRYNKGNLGFVRTYNPEMEKDDKFESISVLQDKLYAITSFGRLYKFDID